MDEERTILVHESPQRLAGTLADLADACGPDRQVAVARELTKLHEEIWRGSVKEAADWFSERPVRGEVVVVLGGAPPSSRWGSQTTSSSHILHALLDGGLGVLDAAATAASELGVPKKRAYAAALGIRKSGEV